jgi:hypothetical protein
MIRQKIQQLAETFVEDVKEGRETIESLANTCTQFEGGDAYLTESVNSRSRDKGTRAIKEYYGSIRAAVDILQAEQTQAGRKS